MELATPDIQVIKQMMKATWEDGDYGKLSEFKKEWDEDFLSMLPVEVDTRLLDVACGTGYFCILAAKKGAVVTGVDIAENLITQARRVLRSMVLILILLKGMLKHCHSRIIHLIL